MDNKKPPAFKTKDRQGKRKSALPFEAQSMVVEAYNRYRSELRRFAVRSYGLDEEETEDLIQTAFEKFASSPHLLSIENPRAFLYKLINNLALNIFRHANVKRRHSLDTKESAQEDEVGVELNPEKIAQHQQHLELISERIMSMPIKRRQIVIMNRFEHLSYAEIGRKLEITEAAVRKHIKRALQEINESADDHGSKTNESN